jgi:hypothetical protein
LERPRESQCLFEGFQASSSVSQSKLRRRDPAEVIRFLPARIALGQASVSSPEQRTERSISVA